LTPLYGALLEPPPLPALSEFSQGCLFQFALHAQSSAHTSLCAVLYMELFSSLLRDAYAPGDDDASALISRRNAWLLHVGIPNIDKCRTLPACKAAARNQRGIFALSVCFTFLAEKNTPRYVSSSLRLLGRDGSLFTGKRAEK
jgi:hypothetical protein